MQKLGEVGSSEMRHAASIPSVIVDRYCNEHNISLNEFIGNKDHIKRILNDPSLEYFRIWRGKI
jgi:hypothetical protein